jgi:CHAT domain-containing protein
LQWYINDEKFLVFLVSSHGNIKYWESSENDRNRLIDTLHNYLQLYYSEKKEEWINQVSNFLQSFAEVLHINVILSLVPDTCKRLIIIPHYFLHILPFHAFPIDNNLILQDQYDVKYAPSCQVLKIAQLTPLKHFNTVFVIQNCQKSLYFADLEV